MREEDRVEKLTVARGSVLGGGVAAAVGMPGGLSSYFSDGYMPGLCFVLLAGGALTALVGITIALKTAANG
jgi:hypothetical protein